MIFEEQMVMRNFIIFCITFGLALVLTPLAIKLARPIGALDVPEDNRRMHDVTMPRFGGFAIYISSMTGILIMLSYGHNGSISGRMMTGILIGGTIMFIMGAVDDIRNLPARYKLIGQVFCACLLFAFDVRTQLITNPFTGQAVKIATVVSFLITVLWVVGISNTINLIDGLDGLAAGLSLIATLAIAYMAYIHGRYEVSIAFMALAGSCLGFLPFNFHPAKTFMGDCGALYLGFMIAALSLIGPMKSYTLLATALPVFVLALPIIDTFLAIIRRRRGGRSIMEADKGHLHHRLLSVGLGHTRTVLTLYCISAIMGMAAVMISRDLLKEAVVLFGIAVMLIYVFMKDQKLSEENPCEHNKE